MYIQGYSSYSIAQQLQQLQQQAAEEAAKTNASGKETQKSKDAAQEAAQSALDVWKQLGQEYDVASMSVESMTVVSLTLYENNEINLFEHSILSFDASAGQLGEEADIFRTEADEDGKRDWIAEFQARLEEHQASGDTSAAASDQRILSILERLQAAASGGLNLTV